jgi:hypothetical protein
LKADLPRRHVAAGAEVRVRSFRQSLKESGYLEGENVAIIRRWAVLTAAS